MNLWATCLWIAAAVQPAETTSANVTLTLAEAESIAMTSAFDVRVAQSGLDRASQIVRSARGAAGFQFSVGANYTRFDQPIFTFAGAGPASIIDQKTTTATLTIPIDIAGIFRKGIAAAEEQEAAAAKSLEAAQNALRAQVRFAYYGVLLGRSAVVVREDALATIQRRLADAQTRFEAGVVAQFDVLRLETEVARAKADLIDAQNGFSLAKNALNNTLGRPIETPFEPVDVPTPTLVIDVERLVDLALASRPDVAATEAGVRALARFRETEERGLRPSLALSGQYTRTIDALRGQRENQVVGVVQLSVPLHDSGITRARVNAAREDERQAQIRLEQLQLAVALQVRQAALRLKNASEQLEVTDKLVSLQAEALRLAQLRFDVGQGILLDVNQAQTDLTAARVSQHAARYELLSAIAELHLAVGADTLTPSPQAASDSP